jgi:segregation and condensation protein A
MTEERKQNDQETDFRDNVDITSVDNSAFFSDSKSDSSEETTQSSENIFLIDVPVYEGPMDLLLFVVRQRQIDLMELPLSQIAKDFLEYSKNRTDLDLDSAGEIILTASVLLRMKVKSLLPNEVEEEIEDPESIRLRDEELEEVYREIVAAARKLSQGEDRQRKHFQRGNAAGIEEIDTTEEMLSDMSIVHLAEAFREVTNRLDSTPIHQLALFKVTVEEMSKMIIGLLEDRVKVRFIEVISTLKERIEVVIAFLAMLELIRYSRIKIRQDELFGSIWITRGPKFDIPVRLEAEAGFDSYGE